MPIDDGDHDPTLDAILEKVEAAGLADDDGQQAMPHALSVWSFRGQEL